MNNKRGRPEKYPDEIIRTETRKKQNRINQQHHRALKKLKYDIEAINKQKKWNTEYQNSIIHFFNKFKYDFFFTGTIDPTLIQNITLLKENQSIKEMNEYIGANLSFNYKKELGLNGLISYTRKYIEYIFKCHGLIRCFGVIEKGKNGKYHVHLLMKAKNNVIEFEKFTENHWLVGKSLTIPIDTKQGQEKLLRYCVKELLPSSDNVIDKLKVDNWFFEGDFELQKENTSERNNIGIFNKNEIVWK
jgi:hypothetical protein